MTVCAICGVEVARAKNGQTVHLGGYDPEIPWHAAERTTTAEEFQITRSAEELLIIALGELLEHHATLCPTSTCVFAENVRRLVSA